MENKDKYLPLWYETGSPADGTYFIGRHLTARGKENNSNVCDYSLYPILRDDADFLLFQTVWDVVMYPVLEEFLEAINVKNYQPRQQSYHHRVSWCRPQLLFPTDDPFTNYEAHEKKLPYIVGCFSMEYHVYGESGLYEEDDTPQFRKYYRPQWGWIQDVKDIVYTECDRINEDDMVMFLDNTTDFKHSIQKLLQLMTDVNAYESSWSDRLQTAVRMIDTHANELHILHQAGLYDIETLRNSLERKGHMNEPVRQAMEDFNCQLRRYAMLTINLIDWKNGGIDQSRILSKAKLLYRVQCLQHEQVVPTFTVSNTEKRDNYHHEAYESTSKGFDWDNVYPRYPFPREEGESLEDYEHRRREWLFQNSR